MLDPDRAAPLGLAAPSPEELVARAKALVPLLRANGPETERLHRLPDTTIRALEEAGVFRMLQPVHRGGYGTDPATLSQVMTAIASGCASTIWVLMIYSSVGQLAELLSEEALGEIHAAAHPRSPACSARPALPSSGPTAASGCATAGTGRSTAAAVTRTGTCCG